MEVIPSGGRSTAWTSVGEVAAVTEQQGRVLEKGHWEQSILALQWNRVSLNFESTKGSLKKMPAGMDMLLDL